MLKWSLGSVLGLVLLGMAAFAALYLYVDIPKANAAAMAQANIYKTADGKVIARTGQVNRERVPLSQIPQPVQHAFVAAENKTFYSDSGVDLKGMTRALYNTVSGHGKQGGSTITQQYVKNFYLNQNQTVSRKLKELFISLKVDREMSKDQILEGYLNTVFFGRRAYGIQAAAQAYYGVDVSKLTVAQGAYLATLVQAPGEYDMATATPEGKRLATQRWNYVLDNMVQMHWLDPAQRARTAFAQPHAPKGTPGLTGQTGYFVELANKQLTSSGAVDADELAAGGWTITLTIDPAKQKDLEQAVKTELTDQLDPAQRKADADVQAGAVSVDPRNGQVVALYGGAGYPKQWISNATRTDYQVASTFKPLVLAAALENGASTQDGRRITADTVYDGTNRRPVQGTPTPFAPPNEDQVSYGPITVQKAMDQSVNSVFAQMAVDVGLNKVADTAVKLGMPADTAGLRDGPAIALGTMGASPLQMAGIYATFDDHGRKVTPSIVKSAVRGGTPVQLKNPVGDQAVSRSTADTLTSVLTGVVNSGTGTSAHQDSQVAGKTGTSDNNKSAWFTGYTPNLVTSVGLFAQDAKNGSQSTLRGLAGGGRVNGGGLPAQIWGSYTRAALEGTDAQQFDLQTDQGAALQPDTPVGSAPPATSSAPPSTPPSAPASHAASAPPVPGSGSSDAPSHGNHGGGSHQPGGGPGGTGGHTQAPPPVQPTVPPPPTGNAQQPPGDGGQGQG
nr:transglycosylase domain-containing protein [Streptomyces sp. SID5468]